jgi:hypothetical protein
MHACADTHIHSVSVTHAHVQWADSEGVAFRVIAKIALIHTHTHTHTLSLSPSHSLTHIQCHGAGGPRGYGCLASSHSVEQMCCV